MPRPPGDHDARRREVSEAVWRVLAAHGFDGLTLRAVAAELGATTGVVTHYFASKRELVAHALTLLDERTAARRHRSVEPGLGSLRTALVDMLPITPDARIANRVWVSSWDVALADDELRAQHAARYAAGRDRLRTHVEAAQRTGTLPPGDPDRLAAGAHAFALGLIVQAVLDPAAFPRARQLALLDDYLAALGRVTGR